MANSKDSKPNPFAASTAPTRRPDGAGMNAFSTPATEPPPAYSPAAPAVVAPAMASASTTAVADDRYAFLTSFDTVFLIDDSGSMAGRSWRETAKALQAITPICVAHDADGIDIYFLNEKDNAWYHNITSAATVSEIFSAVRPRGGTPTGQRLNQILKPYLARLTANPETKPLNIIVITDGEPSDDVESPIINAAKKLDKMDAPAWQVGIQFFQVGREPGAREHLRQLDDELEDIAGGELRDIVDTVPWKGEGDQELNSEGILKVVLGSVNRRLDRKGSKELYRR
ncbi:Importin subunit beta-2 [Venturia nashicola]|nr:Importin subunit beta-2 [Venturia nashicola]